LDGNTKEQLIQEAINVVGKNWYFMLGYMERVSARRHGGPAISARDQRKFQTLIGLEAAGKSKTVETHNCSRQAVGVFCTSIAAAKVLGSRRRSNDVCTIERSLKFNFGRASAASEPMQ
jgi:hypothetical protein